MCGNHAERWAPYQKDCPSTRGTPEARESSRVSWCPLVAQSLNADYQVECESGNGLVATDGDTCHVFHGSATCMPDKWRYALDCASLGSPGCPKVPPAPFEPHAVLINLGQNDYGKPAHVDPSTGKPVKNHLPPTAMWVRNYAWFLGNITAAQKTAPEFFLACGGMQDK